MIPLAIAAALFIGAANERAVPDTWSALQAELPSDKSRTITALLRFANHDAASVPDRLRAAKAARAAMTGDDRRKVDALLLEAELHGAIGKRPARLQALAQARAAAKKARLEKAARIEEALRADDDLDALVRAVTAFERKRAPVAQEKIDDVKKGEPAWLAIGDERQHAIARMWVARAAFGVVPPPGADAGPAPAGAMDPRIDEAARELADALDALSSSTQPRTFAGARAEILSWRALLLERSERKSEALLDRLAADRARAVDVRTAASEQSANPYVRSKETAAACKVMRTDKKPCAKLEMERWGSRSFYDFTQESTVGFDPARADDALADYEPLLHECLKQGAKDNLTTQTRVELEWAVGNDGRVKSVDVRPLRLRGTTVDTCIRGALSQFRYPRYGGEMQHVRLDFDVGS